MRVMRTQAGNRTKMQQQIALCKIVLPLLTELIESGRISVRLGLLTDVRQWLNNCPARVKKKMVKPRVTSVSIKLNRLQIELGLDDDAA